MPVTRGEIPTDLVAGDFPRNGWLGAILRFGYRPTGDGTLQTKMFSLTSAQWKLALEAGLSKQECLAIVEASIILDGWTPS